MIRQRVRDGLSVIKAKIERDGKFVSKAGNVRIRLGRPGAEADKLDRAREELAKGTGIIKTAKLTGLGTGTVHKLRREMGTVRRGFGGRTMPMAAFGGATTSW